MEAISIGHRALRSGPNRLTRVRAAIRRRRLDRAERAYSMRATGVGAPSIPGSEHTHLLRQRGF